MKKYIYIALTALSVASCKLDDNISQNDPNVEQVTPNLYLSAAQTSSYNVQVSDIFELSNVWMNNWAGNIYYFASPYSAEYQLQVTSAFTKGNNFWNNSYLTMGRYAAIYNNAQADKYPHHAAIAKILMANSMQYIVDFYGDAPFSEAFKREANLTPKYDKGEDIYRNLVLMINDAVATINAIPNPQFTVQTEDEIFSGDMDKWKRLANTIKLRILLRQSKVTDATIKAFVTAQLQTLQGASFLNADATINPGYNNSNETQQNPLIRNYAYLNFDNSAENINGYRLIDISSHFAGLLNGTDTKTGTTDPRRGIMYRAVSGTIRGITQGAGQTAGAGEASFSRMGWKFREINSAQTDFVNNSGIDGVVMSLSESELLQAEAAELYPAIFGNGIGHYENAVRASFRYLGIAKPALPAVDPADTYLANINTKPYGWNGTDGHIAAIQYQRMVALHYIKPQETYINYLKTGYPVTPLALTATQPNKPWRLVYPAREYNTNTANVPNVTQNDVFVKNQFTPFWNRN